MASLLTEPVFLRRSRDFRRVICLQDHSMFRQEAAGVCEQSRFSILAGRKRIQKCMTSTSIVSACHC